MCPGARGRALRARPRAPMPVSILAGRLVQTACLAGWLWLAGWPFGWLADWAGWASRLAGWMARQLAVWLGGWEWSVEDQNGATLDLAKSNGFVITL